jgi:hypothetical protein
MKITIEFDPISEPTLARQIASLLAPTPAEARAALHEAAESAAQDVQQPPSQEAPAQATTRRRGRPPKNAEPAAPTAPTEPTPAGTTPPVAASGAAPSTGAAGEASPVQAPAAPSQAPSDVLEMIYNRDGAATAIACLQRFGVSRLRDLKPEQTAEFVGYCQEVIAGVAKPEVSAQ